jgi:biopolymer transport protein ExbB/TolQ
MDPLVITIIVVAAVVVIGLIVWMATRQRADARRQERAREHLHSAQVRATHAEREQAAAQEQAARARRERAEAEERVALAEREASERMDSAREHRAQAEQHETKAAELDPDLRVEHDLERDERVAGDSRREG